MTDTPDTIVDVGTKTKSKTKKPPRYHVMLLNDDFTPMDFVVWILSNIFNKNETDSTQIMLDVHEKGSAIVGTYRLEIAEQKIYETMETARLNEYPLKAKLIVEDGDEDGES
jgi:ATP-dependent Clp protease adaptor protein ClpS